MGHIKRLEQLSKVTRRYFEHWDDAKISSVVGKYGFEFVASSYRILVRHGKDYYKLDSRNLGDASIEAEVANKIKGTRFEKFFSSVSLVSSEVLQIEFVDGVSVCAISDTALKDKVMLEVETMLNDLFLELKIEFEDIESYNVIYNFSTGLWKIIDYAY